ncbi:hypothetical protein TNCV_39141 [Trichonephila clavipes]|nr:hypothetical protein TNCV_39141 [Trichonephila clavipes]
MARVTTEGRRIPSGYLPFLTRIFYRPRQNDRLRVMFSTCLYVCPTTVRLFNDDEAVLKKISKYSSLEHTVGLILQSPLSPLNYSHVICRMYIGPRVKSLALSFIQVTLTILQSKSSVPQILECSADSYKLILAFQNHDG